MVYAKDLILASLDSSDHILKSYIGDLSEEELTTHPETGMNPIAWQLGHLISSERNMVEMVKPGTCPELPEGFVEAHGKKAGLSDDRSKYLSKDEYVKLWETQRNATKAVLAGLTESELESPPANTFRGMCPTNGHVVNFVASHVLMHVGQFVPIRRRTGKPVVI